MDAYPERVAESRLTVVPCLHASVVCGLYFVTCVDFVFTVVCSARCGSIQKVLQIFSYFQSCLAGPFILFLLLLEQSSVRIGRKYFYLHVPGLESQPFSPLSRSFSARFRISNVQEIIADLFGHRIVTDILHRRAAVLQSQRWCSPLRAFGAGKPMSWIFAHFVEVFGLGGWGGKAVQCRSNLRIVVRFRRYPIARTTLTDTPEMCRFLFVKCTCKIQFHGMMRSLEALGSV